jgi:hypothetical protein
MVETVDHVEHRSLAGAVRADNGDDFSAFDLEAHLLQRMHAAEPQRDVVDLEQDVGRAARFEAGAAPEEMVATAHGREDRQRFVARLIEVRTEAFCFGVLAD